MCSEHRRICCGINYPTGRAVFISYTKKLLWILKTSDDAEQTHATYIQNQSVSLALLLSLSWMNVHRTIAVLKWKVYNCWSIYPKTLSSRLISKLPPLPQLLMCWSGLQKRIPKFCPIWSLLVWKSDNFAKNLTDKFHPLELCSHDWMCWSGLRSCRQCCPKVSCLYVTLNLWSLIMLLKMLCLKKECIVALYYVNLLHCCTGSLKNQQGEVHNLVYMAALYWWGVWPEF